jgi:cytoskeleton protein RodZ
VPPPPAPPPIVRAAPRSTVDLKPLVLESFKTIPLAPPRKVAEQASPPPTVDPPVKLRFTRRGAAPAQAAEIPMDGSLIARSRRPPPTPTPVVVVPASPPVQVAALSERPRAVPPIPRPGIVLHATESTWIEIRALDTGKVIVERLLRAGEQFEVPTGGSMSLTTGNAGGLEVVVDGTVAPKLGPRRAVLRDIALDGQRLLAGIGARR